MVFSGLFSCLLKEGGENMKIKTSKKSWMMLAAMATIFSRLLRFDMEIQREQRPIEYKYFNNEPMSNNTNIFLTNTIVTNYNRCNIKEGNKRVKLE
jgi:hypothetical protein